MIYYYKIRVKFLKGGRWFIKDYKSDFLHLGELFVYLETRHHDNYQLLFVKEYRYGNKG